MSYDHALVLNPYIKESSAAMGFFPPTGLEYVATAMEGLVGKISLVDLRQEKELQRIENLLKFINDEDIDLICISCNWSYYFKEVIALINSLPNNIDIIVGGQQATDYVEELFKYCPNIKIIVRGESEEPMQEILKGASLNEIKGISYKANGSIIHNPVRALADVNKICFPDRRLRRTTYHLKSKNIILSKSGFDTVLTARGCPYSCKFCTFNLNPLGQRRFYSARSPESIIEELKTVDSKVIFLADDNFFVNQTRVSEICDLIIQEKIDKRFISHARLEIAKHPRMLEKAYEAGFRVMLMGIESPHDKILKLFNKGFTRKDIEESFAVLKKIPFYYHGYFIFGNIGETEDEMVEIAEFAEKIGVDSISAQKLRLEKYSTMKEIIEKTPGYYYNTTGFVYSDKYDVDKLSKIGKKIKKGFYTPKKLFMIAKKVYSIGIFTKEDLLYLLFQSPKILAKTILREIEKKTGKMRKRIRQWLPIQNGLPSIEIKKKI